MLIDDFQSRIEKELKWKRIEDIPELPAGNFAEVKQKASSGEFSVGIDFTTANELAAWMYGRRYATLFLFLTWVPYLAVLMSIVLAIAMKSSALLLGIPVIIVAELGSNPYIPFRRVFNGIFLVAVLGFLWALWTDTQLLVYLSGFFVVSFWTNRHLYNRNSKKLRQVALGSEAIFIYLYQIGKLGLKDSTGTMYWCREAVLKEARELLKRQ